MAQIPRAALDYLTEQVRGLVADASGKVSRLLESIEWRPDSIAECRAALVDALLSVMPTYTDAAAQAGADFYDAVRAAEVGEAMGALAVSGFDREAFEGAVRAFVQDVVDGKPAEQLNGKVIDRVDRDIRRSANMSVAENARRDPLKPKYARVPSGGETCEFCIMLASRGAVYGTEEAASHAHPGCDCRVVPSFGDGSEIEGYDPDALYDEYIAARKAYAEANGRLEGLEFKNSVGAVYNDVYKARDLAVSKLDLDNLKLKQNQRIHIEGSPQFKVACENRRAKPSCFTLDEDGIKDLIKRHAGHGEPEGTDGGEWARKEVCVSDRIIGFVFSKDGKKIPTRAFKIHYAESMIHAVPMYDKGGDSDDLG